MNRKSLIAAISITWLAMPLKGELSFERTRVELTAEFGEARLEAAYPFENKSDKTIKVLEIQSGCGCTVPELEKKTYEPGEKGVLKATFNVGERQGPQRQVITVRTDAGEQSLRLAVDIPVRVTIDPRMILFRSGEKGRKSASLVYAEDIPVVIEKIESGQQYRPTPHPLSGKVEIQSSSFEITMETVEEGKSFLVHVRLDGRGEEDRSMIQIQSRGASGRIYTDLLYVRRIR